MSWAIILAQLPALIEAGGNLWEYINSIRSAAQQDGEWTPELEQQFQEKLNAAKLAPHQQPDP